MSTFSIPLHLSLLVLGLTAPVPGPAPAPAPASAVTASVEQCTPAVDQSERSATFAAQMTALDGTQRMSMKIEVQERSPTDLAFHTVLAPGLGVWRQSETGVKIYKYVKQVTNLAAPALFRAQVRFRWFDDRGRVVKRAQRFTSTCVQPVEIAPPPVEHAPTGSGSGSGSSSGAGTGESALAR
jgi:hypothetical protein